MLFLLVMLALGCTPDTPPDDSTPPGDSTPSGETSPPEETDPPPDDSAPPIVLPAVLVNELMSDNGGAYQRDDGAYEDWVELFNHGDEAVDLSGYALSDDWTDKDKAPFHDGTVIEAGGYLLLWADGSDEPGRLPFKLSSQGEGVGLFTAEGDSVDWITFPALVEDYAYARLPNGDDTWEQLARGTPGASNVRVEVQSVVVVAKGSTWAYLDSGEYPGETWVQPSFDDSDWASGPAPLGYGDSQTTQVSYGDDSSNKHITTWFRHGFEVSAEALEAASDASVELRVDDGGVVWLNGVELLRHGMAEGEFDADTYASDTASSDGESNYTAYDIDLALLNAGDNQLAVEVHQVSATSSDITLDLALEVEGWAQTTQLLP